MSTNEIAAAWTLLADESHDAPARPAYAAKDCPRCQGKGYRPGFAHMGGNCARVDCHRGQIPATAEARRTLRAWTIAKRLAWVVARGTRLSQALALVEPVATPGTRAARFVAEWTPRRDELRAEWRKLTTEAASLG